jgi:predicted phage terminase large subunit-like protein
MVVGSNGSELFLLETWADRATPTDLGAKILELNQRWKPTHIVIEKVGYQEALADVMELLAREKGMQGRLPIYEHATTSEQRKEVRINGLEPWFRKGLFYVDPTTQHSFIEEYTHYPYAQLRDQLDALSFQKDLWERLAQRDGERGDPGGQSDWHAKQRVQADRIRERMGRGRHHPRGGPNGHEDSWR